MRDLKNVINQILILTSKDCVFDILNRQLYGILQEISYKSPELIVTENWWNITYNILKDICIPPKKEIDYKILSIWTTKSIKELQEMED